MRLMPGMNGVRFRAKRIREGMPLSMASRYPWIRHVLADGVHAWDKLVHALAGKGWRTIRLIKRPEEVKGFVLVPRRWSSNDPSARTILMTANVGMISRRLARIKITQCDTESVSQA
jgi:hypothetical protein